MSSVNPFEKRWLHPKGDETEGKQCILIRQDQTAGDGGRESTEWHCLTEDGLRKADLVSTRTVGKTKRDGVTYRKIPDPGEDDRAMMIEALDAHLRGRNATSSTELGAMARIVQILAETSYQGQGTLVA